MKGPKWQKHEDGSTLTQCFGRRSWIKLGWVAYLYLVQVLCYSFPWIWVVYEICWVSVYIVVVIPCPFPPAPIIMKWWEERGGGGGGRLESHVCQHVQALSKRCLLSHLYYIFLTNGSFKSKLSLMVDHHKLKCPVKDWFAVFTVSATVKVQLMFVRMISFELLNLLQPNLVLSSVLKSVLLSSRSQWGLI